MNETTARMAGALAARPPSIASPRLPRLTSPYLALPRLTSPSLAVYCLPYAQVELSREEVQVAAREVEARRRALAEHEERMTWQVTRAGVTCDGDDYGVAACAVT